MRTTTSFAIALSALAFQGCASLAPLNYEMHPAGGDLKFVKSGCQLAGATFTDTTGRGYSGGLFQMVSVDSAGNTMDEFYISCKPVGAYRTSQCSISAVGSTSTYMTYGGPACPTLREFMLVRR